MPERVMRIGASVDPADAVLGTLRRLGRAMGTASRRMVSQYGLTPSQRRVLRLVGRFPSMTAGQLATALHVDPGTVSASLRRLERRGLIVRRRDPRDGRRVLLGLTRAGHALEARAGLTVEDAVRRALRGTAPQALRTTVSVLSRVADGVDPALPRARISGRSRRPR